MLTFTPISGYRPGDLFEIICRSYEQLIRNESQYWKQEEKEWANFDHKAFSHPEIARCIFVTCLDNTPIGLASYDPRHFPEYGVIGQNCVLPEFGGRGFGSRQIQEVLRIFQEHQAKIAKVTTSEHPFFEPARKMYRSLGFIEMKRIVGGPDPNYKTIELAKTL